MATGGSKNLRSTRMHSEETVTLSEKDSNERVPEADGNFFENFVALSWKRENRRLRENKGKEDQQDASKPPPPLPDACRPLDNFTLTKQEFETLYEGLLYTIQHKVGLTSEGHTPFSEEQFSYAQRAFNVPSDRHRDLLEKASKEQNPIMVLNVTVVEGKGLEAKDANGFSDPYCMLGIMPENLMKNLEENEKEEKEKEGSKSWKQRLSLRGSRKKKRPTTSSVKDDLPARMIRTTQVKKETLNPVWNEKFRFVIDDLKADRLHLDIWDHDDESSVFEAAKKLNEVTGIKGVERYFKQVLQSARAHGGDDIDDFLGAVNIGLEEIPSIGLDKWFDLKGRSSKSTVQGQIRLKISLSTEQRPAENNEFWTAVTAHETIMSKFIDYEARQQSEVFVWDGKLSSVANTILHQHALQNDITEIQNTACTWLAYSKEHMDHSAIDYAFLFHILEKLDTTWTPSALDQDEENMLGRSYIEFIEFSLLLLRKQRDVFPSNNKIAMHRFEYLLRCLNQVFRMELYRKCNPFEKELSTQIIASLKQGTQEWYQRSVAFTAPEVQSEEHDVNAWVSLVNILNDDLQKLIQHTLKPFEEIVHVDYFSVTYKELDKMLAKSIETAMRDCNAYLKRLDGAKLVTDPQGNQGVGISLFELYLALKEFKAFKTYLGSSSEARSLALSNYHEWFKLAVQKWFEIARHKATYRIKKAVELDKISQLHSLVKHSTSAVDTSCCFAQIRDFWLQLSWPDTEGSYIFVAKVTDDLCHGSMYYADIMHDKLKQNGYYDDEGQFDVTEQLCITINNIEQVRRCLQPLPQQLGWTSIQQAMEKKHGEEGAKTCHATLTNMMASADEDMSNKIGMVVKRVAEKMQVDIKKHVFHLTWAPLSVPTDEAICPLMEYLDNNLITLNNGLLKSNFDRILGEIWILVLNELTEQVNEDDHHSYIYQKEPIFFGRLLEALDVIVDFFHADGKGLSSDTISSDSYLRLATYLKVNKATTEELIEYYCLNRIREQTERKSSGFGVLNVKCYYSQDREKLIVYVMNASNVIPLDSNGFSDPYVVIEVLPHHTFSRQEEKRTRVIKKTLHPLFEEIFEFVVSIEQCQRPSASLLFTVMDHDVILQNDFAGEAYLSLDQIKGLKEKVTSLESVSTVALPLDQPKETSCHEPAFMTLEARNYDKQAQEFVKKRRHLIEKVNSQS